MDELILAVERALSQESWHAALALSLALPDICGKIDEPKAGSRARYANWFNTFVGSKYQAAIGVDLTIHVFLSGNDCYALRCAYLHEGSADISQQRARETLSGFQFIVTPPSLNIHINDMGGKLQLDVREFCRDIIFGVRNWLETNPTIPFDNLLRIQDLNSKEGTGI